MIYIAKQQAPMSLIQYRKKHNASFEDMDAPVKTELRQSLLKEQGYLCAYCMRRLKNEREVKIEHYIARNPQAASDIQTELTYANMLAVCRGNEGKPYKEQTCDTRKGNRDLHINPCKLSDIDTIYYSSQGRIKSTNVDYCHDLNEILNLNCVVLVKNRETALKALQRIIFKRSQNREAKRFMTAALKKYENKNGDGEYAEYAGIFLWYLRKKIYGARYY